MSRGTIQAIVIAMSEAATPNEPYRVLARKYRPQNFEDLIGQEPMVQTLSNAFRTGRIAQAYMLTGVRGVGKTTTARILARALNFKNDAVDQPTIDLSENGEHCQAIVEGRHMDVIEMDAASHTGIDAMRDLIDSVQYRPTTARYKVYIVDEVHMLSGSAFNALLKTLEEPPEHVKFIFATTEIRKVPVTVLSRCQRFDLRRIEAGTLAAHLASICEKERVSAEEDALAMIARAADGSVRDSLSMLDQAIAHGAQGKDAAISAETMRNMLGLSDRARIVDLFEHVMKGDIAAALGELKEQYNTGAEPAVVLTDLADFIHLVTRLKYVPDTENDRALSEIERTRGKEFADKLSVRILGRAWQMLLKGLNEVSNTDRPLAVAEMILVRMTHASSLPTPDELAKQAVDAGASRSAPLGQSTDGIAGGTTSMSTPPTSVASTQNGNQPMMSGEQSGAQALAMQQAALIAEKATETNEPSKPLRTVSTFEQLIFLVEDKRDLALKTAIKRHIRLVSFADGRIEMNLVENPSREFLPTLGKRLEEWTGKRWMLSVSKEEGAPTLAEIERKESEARLDDARSNPAVEAVLKQFPGSKIVDIRIRDEETEAIPEAPEDDESLDEFFE
ncbi:MAG: DNA polymerase III subunit gamma/tau [Pseudomonadota bacterium]